jgi:predicted amidohydrolase
MNLTISLAQTQILLGRPEDNFLQVRALIKEAASQGSECILFPELWSSGYDLENARALAKINRGLLPEIAALSAQHAIHIGGSLLLEENGNIYNTFVFQSPGGGRPAAYAKIHLFRLMAEDRWLSAGDHLELVQAPWGGTGLAICYDLRFPELFRSYALSGASLFLIAAEWPAARINHWQTLLRARAIENQCFVAAANTIGLCGGEVFGGRSALISPWGDILAEASADQPELITHAIHLEQVQEARQRIPILSDRRPDLYG